MASKFREYSTTKTVGRVYTPDEVVKLILDESGYSGRKILGKRVIDPACGDGQFLVEIVGRIIRESPKKNLESNLAMVTGWDLEMDALAACRTRLNRLVEPLGLQIEWNLFQGDSIQKALKFKTFEDSEKYDFVVGNPPYVRIQHLEKITRDLLVDSFSFCQRGSTDLYLAFLELGLMISRKSGRIGFITPNSFMLTDAGAPTRKHFANGRNVEKLINFGAYQLFEDASTYAAITIYGHKRNSELSLEHRDENLRLIRVQKIDYAEVATRKVWNFEVSQDLVGHVPLKSVCSIHVGIQTLADKVFVIPNTVGNGEKSVKVVSKLDLGEFSIELGLLKPAVKASKLKPNWDGQTTELMLWPYQPDQNGVMSIIPEDKLRESFPLAYEYLLAHRNFLNLRDNGQDNPVAWYAFGRSQHLTRVLGPKLIFPPMAETPFFVKSQAQDLVVYSGYFIKYEGELSELEEALNSKEMKMWVAATGRDFRGAWKSISKKTIEDFPVAESLLVQSETSLF